MVTACSAAVASLMEELADDSVLQEASSSEDDEFLFFLLIDSKERKSHVRIDDYFERIMPLYNVSDFQSFSDDFHTMRGRNMTKLRPLTTTQILYVNTRGNFTEMHLIYEVPV